MNREVVCVETQSSVEYSVIWMHGLGASADDFVPIIPELHLPKDMAGIRFIFPNAPLKPVTLNAGYIMPAWYDLYSLEDFRAKEDEAGLRESQNFIRELIQKEVDSGIAEHHIFLAGFSQGAAMTLMTGLRHSKPLAGLIVLSGYIPLLTTFEKEVHSANIETPIFLAHGRFDPVVPFNLFEESYQKLKHHHYSVESHIYSMEHSVCLDEINDISLFIQSVIQGKKSIKC